ncbi:MAG: hypothetical protein FJ290_03065 [Planctomycetes bacterium]|nr:hypothetical protein [Planctomycetota bacterium]
MAPTILARPMGGATDKLVCPCPPRKRLSLEQQHSTFFRDLSARALAALCLAAAAAIADQPREVVAPPGQRAVALLVPRCPPAFNLEVSLLWTGKGEGAELLLGPNAFGASGYRVAAGPPPWGTAECRGPRLEAKHTHDIEVRVRPRWLEYWLGGSLVARCPAEVDGSAGVRLAVAPGCRAVVSQCRLRAVEAASGEEAPGRFVYAALAFPHEGRRVPDGLAAGGQAVEVRGAGRNTALVKGQDAALGLGGRYAAIFGLRGVEGAGSVWLDVATVEGQTLASARVRLEELPTDRYARLSVPFAYTPGAPVEFRVALERGTARVDQVAVEGVEAGAGRPVPARERRARALAEVWGKARPGPAAALAIVRLERRLAAGGWYEFRVVWQQKAAERLDDVAADLWVATRDAWGIVRVFDLGAACDAVPPGPQAATAWFDPALIPRVGPPVALLAQLYCKGAPVASASRKWGIPVDDVYIVGAQRAGALREAPPLTE